MKKQSVNKISIKLVKHRRKAAIKAKRPIHKKFLLHPAGVMLILSIGVLLIGWTWKSSAAEYSVTAIVPAQLLTEPAVITTPKNGARFTSQPILVAGTCPYMSYIKLYRNEVFAGTAICNPGGSFNLNVGLINGQNNLQAHIFNTTDEEGPLSSAVTVFYNPLAPPGAANTIKTQQPFIITSDYRYRAFLVKNNIEWQVTLSGGVSPYALNIKWGDGSESNYVQKDPGALKIEHIYSKSGIFKIAISGSDMSGNSSYLQLNVIVVKNLNALITSPTNPPDSPTSNNPIGLLWLMWPAYAVLVLMVASFWLGEREEYLKTIKYHNQHRRRHA